LQQIDLRIDVVYLGHVEIERVGNSCIEKRLDDIGDLLIFEELVAQLLDRPAVAKLERDVSGLGIDIDPALARVDPGQPVERYVDDGLPDFATDLMNDDVGGDARNVLGQRMDRATRK
jgi:hypothetical protein